MPESPGRFKRPAPVPVVVYIPPPTARPFSPSPRATHPAEPEILNRKSETVVLIHGLWLPGWCLASVARRLRRCGFDVRVFSYPTVRDNLERDAGRLDAYLRRLETDTAHLVGYSLGGVVIRALFHYHPGQKPGRLVTLGSPHQGSLAGRRLARREWGRRILGRGVADLLAGEAARWPLPPRELGTISGRFGAGLGRLLAPDLPGPNDGTLTVAETQLTGAADRIVLNVSHSGMLFSRQVAGQTCCFLHTGRFAR